MMRFVEQVMLERTHDTESREAGTPPAAPAMFMLPIWLPRRRAIIAVSASDPVIKVKQLIADLTELSTDSFALESPWDVLQPNMLLSDHDIVDGSEPITVVVHPVQSTAVEPRSDRELTIKSVSTTAIYH